jgi:hypothetical protein
VLAYSPESTLVPCFDDTNSSIFERDEPTSIVWSRINAMRTLKIQVASFTMQRTQAHCGTLHTSRSRQNLYASATQQPPWQTCHQFAMSTQLKPQPSANGYAQVVVIIEL